MIPPKDDPSFLTCLMFSVNANERKSGQMKNGEGKVGVSLTTTTTICHLSTSFLVSTDWESLEQANSDEGRTYRSCNSCDQGTDRNTF